MEKLNIETENREKTKQKRNATCIVTRSERKKKKETTPNDLRNYRQNERFVVQWYGAEMVWPHN